MIRASMKTFMISKPTTDLENFLLLMQDTIFLLPDEPNPPVDTVEQVLPEILHPSIPVFSWIFSWTHNYCFIMLVRKMASSPRIPMGMSFSDRFLHTKSSTAFPSIHTLHVHLSTPNALACYSCHFEGRCTAWTCTAHHCEHPWLVRERKPLLNTVNLTCLP